MNLADLEPGQTFERLLVVVDRDHVRNSTGQRPMAGKAKRGIFEIDGSVNEFGMVVVTEQTEVEFEERLIPELFPTSKRPINGMVSEMLEMIQKFPGEAKTFAVAIVDHPLFESFKRSPAAMSNHHAYVGGLLEHTLSMLRLAHVLADHYQGQYDDMLDRGVLYCGVLMHDFAKTLELGFGTRIRYTTEGRLLGHIPMGFELVGKICEQNELSEAFKMRLQHAVLSHHGKKEYGAPIEPHTPEAILLHNIDMLDSRMNMCWNAVVDARRSEDGWSDYARPLGARIYVGEPE